MVLRLALLTPLEQAVRCAIPRKFRDRRAVVSRLRKTSTLRGTIYVEPVTLVIPTAPAILHRLKCRIHFVVGLRHSCR